MIDVKCEDADVEPVDVTVLELGTVVLPTTHPRASDGTCPIRAFVVHHGDGLILVDTGVADDHDVINELYQPTIVPIIEALNSAGLDERDVAAIVNTHLHFDHCGQNRSFPSVPVHVQDAEIAAANEPFFTVPSWAAIEPTRVRSHDGDAEIAPGIRLLATPGHTPGHQSVEIVSPDGASRLIVGQACYTCAEFRAAEVADGDLHDETWAEAGNESIRRLAALTPTTAWFSHDRTVFRSA